jgi:hypothetical protein
MLVLQVSYEELNRTAVIGSFIEIAMTAAIAKRKK